MKLVILAVGRGRASPEQALAQDWLNRLPQGGTFVEVESRLPSGPARTLLLAIPSALRGVGHGDPEAKRCFQALRLERLLGPNAMESVEAGPSAAKRRRCDDAHSPRSIGDASTTASIGSDSPRGEPVSWGPAYS